MLTLGDLREALRDRLDERDERYWKEEELTRWLNEGLRDVARRTEVLQERRDVAVLEGTQELTMPTDVVRIHRIEFRPTSDTTVYPLEYRDFNNMDAVWWTHQTVTEGDPVYYTLWGFPPSLKLILYPKPSRAGSLKVFYYKLPENLNSDNEIAEIPEGWDDLVILYAEYMALRKDADPRWQEAYQDYEAKLLALHDGTRRWTDQAGMISTGTSAVPSWIWGGDDGSW